MTTISNESSGTVPETRGWSAQLFVPEMWASLAIMTMWLAVLFDALFGPDIVDRTVTGSTTVPSAVALGLFAFLGTWVVAKYGYGRRQGERG
jgi:multisubunit Na+/H+ antiporter MnhF subunit